MDFALPYPIMDEYMNYTKILFQRLYRASYVGISVLFYRIYRVIQGDETKQNNKSGDSLRSNIFSDL